MSALLVSVMQRPNVLNVAAVAGVFHREILVKNPSYVKLQIAHDDITTVSNSFVGNFITSHARSVTGYCDIVLSHLVRVTLS